MHRKRERDSERQIQTERQADRPQLVKHVNQVFADCLHAGKLIAATIDKTSRGHVIAVVTVMNVNRHS